MLNSNHLFQDSFIFVLIRDVDATNFKYFLYSNKGSASHLQIPHWKGLDVSFVRYLSTSNKIPKPFGESPKLPHV